MASLWDQYEARPEQIQMALNVQKSLKESSNFIIEAGTGVGKSLAYLIPAILYSLETGKTVVISTETKALQQQLLTKDIPLASRILNREVKAEVAMGASNYICKRKTANVFREGTFGLEMADHLDGFNQWLNRTNTGIKSEYKGVSSFDFWSKVTREADNCLGKRCPNFSSSFYFLEKEKWKSANILIVNHALLSAHVAGEFQILPPFSNLILDEAHNFPEIFGKAFQVRVGHDDLAKLLGFLSHPSKETGFIFELEILIPWCNS